MVKRFKQDVARWVIPEQKADLSLVTFKTALKCFVHYMPVQAMFLYRTGVWLHKKRIRLLPFIIQRLLYLIYGVELGINQEIGGGLYIAHPIGTVISVARMGENCTIIANVTIGMRNKWVFPRIGNNVFIGAGARVLGDIEIGDDAVIGANAVVISDVPAGATVVGIPAKIIKVYGEKVESSVKEEQIPEAII